MKVLQFLDTRAMAGTEVHIHTLAKALCDPIHKTQVFVGVPKDSPLWKRCRKDKIPLISIPRRSLIIDPFVVRQLVKLLQNNEIDLIHAHNGRTSLHASLAVYLARKGQFIYTQHFLNPAHTERRGLYLKLSLRIHNWIHKRCSHVIAISKEVQKNISSRGDVPIENTTVIYNGVNDPLETNFFDRNEARRILGISPKTFVIFSAGRLEKEKNMGLLIQSMSNLKNLIPECCCYIAGEGSLRTSHQSQIANLQLDNQVKLLGFRDDVHLWMRASNIFVLPCPVEAFGLVLIEVMALERPVIACDAGGPKEIVVNGSNGFLIKQGSQQDMCSRILSYYNNPSLAEDHGKSGRKRFLKLFNTDNMATLTARAYHNLNTLHERGTDI